MSAETLSHTLTRKQATTARSASIGLRPTVNAYLLATAHAATWREKMEAWEREELARFEYRTNPEYVERGRMGERVREPKDTFMLEGCRDNTGDFAEFHRQRQYFVDSLKVEGLQPGHCPACVAETLAIKAANLLLECADEYVPGISAARNRYPQRQQAIDLLVGLVVNAPGYVAPKLGV
jgi:hypothetical protein